MENTQITEPLAQKTRPSFWSIFFTLALAMVLLVFAFRGVEWQGIVTTLQEGRLDYLAASTLIFTVSLFFRGLRWRVLLNAERTIAMSKVFWAMSVGYLGNAFLPARAGEVMRCVMVRRVNGTSMSFAFVTAMTERILDALILVIISLFALTTLKGLPEWLMTAAKAMGIMGVVAIAGLIVAPRMERWFHLLLNRLPLAEPLHTRLGDILTQFLQGMRAFQHPGRSIQFALLSVVIWLSDAALAITIGWAFHLSLNLAQSLLLLAALGLSSAAPSTPGYLGIYQFVAVTVLVPFGFTQEQALVYIIAFQSISYLVITVWGAFGFWRLATRRIHS